MTYKEFLAKLRKTPKKWSLDSMLGASGLMRFEDGTCPLQRVAGLPKYVDPDVAGIELNMTRRTQNRIQRASDNWRGYRKTRRDLLKACGLREKKP